MTINSLEERKAPNTACTRRVRAFARTFGSAAPTADSASGGFVRQRLPLPVPRIDRGAGRLPLGALIRINEGESQCIKKRKFFCRS